MSDLDLLNLQRNIHILLFIFSIFLFLYFSPESQFQNQGDLWSDWLTNADNASDLGREARPFRNQFENQKYTSRKTDNLNTK